MAKKPLYRLLLSSNGALGTISDAKVAVLIVTFLHGVNVGTIKWGCYFYWYGWSCSSIRCSYRACRQVAFI